VEVKELAREYKQYVIDLRREFHSNPELSLKEFETSKRVKEELKKMGVPFTSVAGTGVVGTIEGIKPGKVVALRADMDALEIQELNDVSYKSKKDGLMHGCGHDGHTAMLLGAAKILTQMKDQINGTVKLFFQPAEETAEGAQQMIEEGVLEGVDGVFGIHLWSDVPCGKVSVEAGPRMAATDIFTIKVKGKGGHGSMPHQGIDAVVVASAIVMNLQSIVSREISPMDSAVVSVGALHSGTRFNVIAPDAVLHGTSRCFDPSIRKKFPKIIERIAKNTAASYRAEATLEYIFGTPPVINDSKCSEIATNSVKKLLGDEGVGELEKITGGEDFAKFMEKVPGALALVGIRNEKKQADYPHHHPRFNMDEDGLEVGSGLYAQYAIDFLKS